MLGDGSKVGNYRLGCKVGNSPVKCISNYIARKDGTQEFFVVKILTLKKPGEKETMDDIQGKRILHNEHVVLSQLKNLEGIVHEHGLFRTKDHIRVPKMDKIGTMSDVLEETQRLCLIVDCYEGNDHAKEFKSITNVQRYVIGKTKLEESEAIDIFLKVAKIVERLHQWNVVHRDLKLGNIVYNKTSKEVSLSNFLLANKLLNENELLKDQRGSPAYIAPEIISGKPYLGQPVDMWALGVTLYTMLYGHFPFYSQEPQQLYRAIQRGVFTIPRDVNVSQPCIDLIKALIVLDPKKRLTASETVVKARSVIKELELRIQSPEFRLVPECIERSRKRMLSPVIKPTSPVSEFIDFVKDAISKSTQAFDSEPQEKKAKLEVEAQSDNQNVETQLVQADSSVSSNNTEAVNSDPDDSAIVPSLSDNEINP